MMDNALVFIGDKRPLLTHPLPGTSPSSPHTSARYKPPPPRETSPSTPPTSAWYKPPPPPRPRQPASPSTSTRYEKQESGGRTGTTGNLSAEPRGPAAVPRNKLEGTSGEGNHGISQDNFEAESRTSDPAATNGFNASLTATRMPPAAGSSPEADGRIVTNQVGYEGELESRGTLGISSSANGQDPPPPAAATSHTSTHGVGSQNNPLLPVSNQPNSENGNPTPSRENGRSFKEWYESSIGDLLPDGVVQLRVAVCGFSLYGIMTLFGSTQGIVKDFGPNLQVLVFIGICFIWAMARTRLGLLL